MPTPEEIKKIAIEYAKWHGSIGTGITEDMLNWLSKDYCIVPKERVDTIYAEAATQPDGPLSSEDFINLGMRAAINKIFGNG